MEDNKQDVRLSSHTEEELNEIKEVFLHHFQSDNIQHSIHKRKSALNEHGRRPYSIPDYRGKTENPCRSREKVRIQNENKTKLLQQAQSSWSPAARSSSITFVLFQGEQREFFS